MTGLKLCSIFYVNFLTLLPDCHYFLLILFNCFDAFWGCCYDFLIFVGFVWGCWKLYYSVKKGECKHETVPKMSNFAILPFWIFGNLRTNGTFWEMFMPAGLAKCRAFFYIFFYVSIFFLCFQCFWESAPTCGTEWSRCKERSDTAFDARCAHRLARVRSGWLQRAYASNRSKLP